MRHSSHEEETTFTESDLNKLIELHPPDIMPNGNVGTPTMVFLKLIQECRLPPVVIKKLGLTFPKTRSNKKYGSVHFDYGGEVAPGASEEDSVVISGRGHDIQELSDLSCDHKDRPGEGISNPDQNQNKAADENSQDVEEDDNEKQHSDEVGVKLI